ncbi:MAG: mechanosensitive ion channel, partial [Proteobacteria bacterium]|nr:mechanosensitive ion channel [Pseudomonadota bacterium]
GSDIKKVEETLFKIAKACDKVTDDDPKPKVIFKEFGDSCLNFELRVYIKDVDDYLKVWHKINCDIDTEFRKNDIEIAFPQRDLHFRSSDIQLPITISKLEQAQPDDNNDNDIVSSTLDKE